MYKFCSYCVLGRHTGTATFKAYGVSEDCGYVVFQYNTIENEAALVRLKRPVIEPDRSGYNLYQYTNGYETTLATEFSRFWLNHNLSLNKYFKLLMLGLFSTRKMTNFNLYKLGSLTSSPRVIYLIR